MKKIIPNTFHRRGKAGDQNYNWIREMLLALLASNQKNLVDW